MIDLNETARVALETAKRREDRGQLKSDTMSILKHCAMEVVEAVEANQKWCAGVFLCDGRGGFGSSACVGVSVVGGGCMRCEPILAAMDCVGGACADCTAVGYCVGLKRRCGFTLAELAQDFDEFFYGVRERNSPVRGGV